MNETTLFALLPSCLHKLYDADILDEVVILKWYSKPHQIDDMVFTEDKRKTLRENPVLYSTFI